jgi:plastocyanin
MSFRIKVSMVGVAAVLCVAPITAGTIEGSIRARAGVESPQFVVSVEDIGGTFSAPATHAVMDQRGLRFIPHVLAVLVGTTVDFTNSDPLLHNVFSISAAKRFNLGLYGGGAVRSILFDQPGVVQLLCNVHQEMTAYIVVLRNPYFVVVNKGERYRIENVPSGRHRIRCWGPQFGEREITVNVPETGSTSGDFEMHLSHGQ